MVTQLVLIIHECYTLVKITFRMEQVLKINLWDVRTKNDAEKLRVTKTIRFITIERSQRGRKQKDKLDII